MDEDLKPLINEAKWESHWSRRLKRYLMYKLGFSMCRYCTNCLSEGGQYKGYKESILMTDGKCKWSQNSVSSDLSAEDMRKLHRCPAFIPLLYNFKGYAIDPTEIKRISSKRLQYFITWMGWLIALLIALFKP